MAERGLAEKVGDGEQIYFNLRNVQLLKKETLGTGSYGAVCKAKCDQLICAAKLLYPVLFQIQAPDPRKEHRQPIHRFEQECRFLSRVNHPNIVQYLGTYRDPETNAPVLLMELMDESLTHFLESSPGDIPYHIQVNLSQDIAQALSFLHANGIIHRDLSSNNVLLIAGSRAKVSDFGMSKFTDHNATCLATMTTCPGTPAYMSPEAFDEPPVYTEKLDNFSFGVILIQIVTKYFPAPTDRFKIERIPDRNSRMIEARFLIPEVERRQAHINLIEPNHPLLPIALECLKDKAVERPFSQQLCQSLDTLQGTDKYEESKQKDIYQLLQEQVREKVEQIQAKDQELQAKDQELQAKDQDLQAKDQDLQSKDQELQAKDQDLQSKDQELQSKDQELQAKDQELQAKDQELQAEKEALKDLRWEVKAKDCQLQAKDDIFQLKDKIVLAKAKEVKALQHKLEAELRRFNQQLEQSTCTLQHTITQRDREIAELREMLATRDCSQSQTHHSGVHTVQESPNSKEQISMSWEILSPEYVTAIVVVDEKVYFNFGGSISEYIYTNGHRNILPAPPVNDAISLVNIKNELTIVGGCFKNKRGNWEDSNKLYSYIRGKWVEKYPPMPTKRCFFKAVCANPVLIVAGGRNAQLSFHTTVETLNTQTEQWSSVSSLPFPTCLPSVSICGEHICVHAGHVPRTSSQEATFVVRCSLFSLAFSTPESDIWEKIASLPVKGSKLVAVNGRLLAVGGESTNEVSTKEVYQYDPSTNSWRVISRMNIARSHCAAALLPDNKLIVGGGSANGKPIELATVSPYTN